MRALSGHNKLGKPAVICLLTAAFLLALPAEAFGKTVSARITVSAIVLPSASVHTVYQAGSIRVTDTDLARGYVDAPAATVINITSQGGAFL